MSHWGMIEVSKDQFYNIYTNLDIAEKHKFHIEDL